MRRKSREQERAKKIQKNIDNARKKLVKENKKRLQDGGLNALNAKE